MRKFTCFILLFLIVWAILRPGARAASDDLPFWWPRALQAAKLHGYGLITWPEFHNLMESQVDMIILDVRTDYEYQERHIPGAVNLEFNRGDLWKLEPEKAELMKQILGPNKNRLVVVYCRSYRCIRSEIASTWAVRHGYKNVRQFPWGFQGYEEIFAKKDSPSKTSRGPGFGDPFPDISLVILGGDRDRSCLDLPPEAKKLHLKDIKTPYLLLMLYDDLSPQRLQPLKELNQLAGRIDDDPQVRRRLRMIGLGVGGLKRVVAKFAKDNQATFPLFADEGYWIHNALGQPELPVNYLLERQPDGNYLVIDKWKEWKGGVAEKYDCIKAQMGDTGTEP